MSKHAAGNGTPSFEPPVEQPKPRRKRVVLADARAPVTVLRTVVELEEQTSYGEQLVRGLIKEQLQTALRVAIPISVIFLAIPTLLYFVPGLNDVTLAGVHLPWLLLGVLPFPLMFGAAYWFNHKAESHERAFVDMVEH
jgi:hypothetical protein